MPRVTIEYEEYEVDHAELALRSRQYLLALKEIYREAYNLCPDDETRKDLEKLMQKHDICLEILP